MSSPFLNRFEGKTNLIGKTGLISLLEQNIITNNSPIKQKSSSLAPSQKRQSQFDRYQQ